MSPNLTMPQRRLLELLLDGPSYPRALARQMWPDSKGWEKRSHPHDGNRSGAFGATMPMKAATMLWRLKERGYTTVDGTRATEWSITPAGRALVTSAKQ